MKPLFLLGLVGKAMMVGLSCRSIICQSFPSSLWEESDHPTSRRDTHRHISPTNEQSPTVGRLLKLGKEREFVARVGMRIFRKKRENPTSSVGISHGKMKCFMLS